MSRHYMIRCDMEGVGGVVSYEQTRPGAPEYRKAQEWFMAELVALVEGLKAGGADRVVIYDEHYFGRNIDIARLPQGTEAICGKPPYRADWAGGLDESFAGMILLGLHSKDGTPGGLLPHTYEHDIADLVLGGVSIGEIGMEASIAGDLGVPTVMITADSAGVAEAVALLPGIQTVTTKQSLSPSGAVCLPLADVTEKINRTAARIAAHPPDVEPYKVGQPADLKVHLHAGPFLDTLQRLFASQMTDDHALGLSANTATAVWAEYWQIKLRCLAEME